MTAWAVFLVSGYAIASPLGLLWFCNVAMIMTVVGLWLESSLLISIPALGSVAVMLLWSVYMLVQFVFVLTGAPVPFGLGTFMIDPRVPIAARILSLYHVWLPLVLLFGLKRLGYDVRALPIQVALTWTLILLAFLLTPDLTTPAGNVNMVFGISDTEPQVWVSRGAWLVIIMSISAAWYLLINFIFRRLFASGPSG